MTSILWEKETTAPQCRCQCMAVACFYKMSKFLPDNNDDNNANDNNAKAIAIH